MKIELLVDTFFLQREKINLNCVRRTHIGPLQESLVHISSAMAQASLHIYSKSPELSLIGHTNYGCRWRLRPKFRPLGLLDKSAWAFISGICAYVISTEISPTGP